MVKKPFPFFPFLIAAFPVLSLMAYNRSETRLSVIIRPLLFCLLFSVVLLTVFFLIYRKRLPKAALLTGITLILFFSYGHLYNLLESTGLVIRHRYIVIVFGLIFIGTAVLLFRNQVKAEFVKLLNISAIILIAMPILQLSWFYLGEAAASSRLSKSQANEDGAGEEIITKPDVYYIILDMYASPDALLEEYDIDVTDFVSEMESLGFYYASESQSNYNETFTSLSTSLNLQLIGEYVQENSITSGSAVYQDLLIHSEVRSFFESLDYQTVAFSTGYRWSELSDADIFYEIKSTNPLSGLSPFETLLFKSTMVYPFRGYLFALIPDVDVEADSALSMQSLHIETQRNILERLPEIAENKNATFTFAHILIPHAPFVFDEDGSILEDPGYYSGEMSGAIDDFYELDGYTRQVKFISAQTLAIAEQILEESESLPIIVIQADHGWKAENRQEILNLYFFPDQDYAVLYPSITPVNTFRVIFSQYFGMDYELVEDRVIQN
jgi:hypothetical protein